MNSNYSFNTQKYLHCYEKIVSDMIHGMTHATLLSSLSMTFINQMIPLNYAAIQMSKNLLLYTTNTELQNIACHIMNSQSQNIQNMMNIYNSCKCENTQEQINCYLGTYEQISSTLFSSMKNIEPHNDINISFIQQMIPHHYAVIQMSKSLLQYPVCKQLTFILNTTIALQEKDMTQLKSLLQKINSTKY